MFGPQTGYILGAYGAAALILGAMVIGSLIARARARRRLAALEKEERN
jgi:heme exporter protein CcmD